MIEMALALAILLTALAVLVCSALHCEAISRLDGFVARSNWSNHTVSVLVLIAHLSSLVGILLLAWSASFLFSLVERWRTSGPRR